MAQWSRALDAESAPFLHRGMNSERAGSMLRLRESLLKEVQDVLAKEGGSCQVREPSPLLILCTLAHDCQKLPTAVYDGTLHTRHLII